MRNGNGRKEVKKCLPPNKPERKEKYKVMNKAWNETKEGPIYCQGIAIGPDSDHSPTDLHEIPDPAIMEDQSSPVNKDDGISMVVFDLETTGFGKR